MVIYSKDFCLRKLKTWLAAEDALATGQAYQIENLSLSRADLKRVREEIEFWEGKLNAAILEESGSGRNRAFRGVIRDL